MIDEGQVVAPRIGLCLSGGGFRAAFYGLGVLRYLAEGQWLRHVVALSSVSGGSIAAAMLADSANRLAAAGYSLQAYLRETDEPFRRCVTERNIRNRALRRAAAKRLLLQRMGRTGALGEVLSEELFATEHVCDLPAGPQAILTSTDLATGRAFRISRDFIGSFDFGYVDTPRSITLGAAVAASAAAPPWLPPLRLDSEGLGLHDPSGQLALADGGVYDNLGLEWFQGWQAGRPPVAEPADFVIVVDASGVLERDDHRLGAVRGLLRMREIQYAQTRAVRTRWFVEHLIDGKDHGLYLSLKRHASDARLPGGGRVDPRLYQLALAPEFAEALGRLRTDLDRFLPEEADLLSYHGYWSVHALLATFRPDLSVGEPAWQDWAHLPPAEVDRLLAILARGRAFRVRGRSGR